MWLAIPLAILAAAWALLLLDVEPVSTWFYVFAWYPTLALLDGIASHRERRRLWLADPRRTLSLFAWSAPIWLVFEAVNLRIANWYYVYLPRSAGERWAGILLSFATVVPAVVLAERFWRALGVGRRWRARPVPPGVRDVRHLTWIGGIALAGVLLWPHWLYPLTWGATLLIADPIVYRHRPDLSLIADLERGDWGRVGRLMLGGVLIGAIWEGYNFVARGKWIYTVPLLEQVKWFEMPPLGFVGFPFFALEAWAMYHALAVLGLAVPAGGERAPEETVAGERGPAREHAAGERRPARAEAPSAGGRLRRSALIVGLTLGFSVATLVGMERWTISSTVPVLELLAAPELRSPWQFARLDPRAAAIQLGVSTDAATEMVELARLMTLRGIGAAHARELARAGVPSVCDLGSSVPGDLWRRLHQLHPDLGRRPTEAEVRVWVAAAQRACRP